MRRSTQNGGAIKAQARRLEEPDFKAIRKVLDPLVDCNSDQQTAKKFVAFSLTLFTRGHEEQWSLRWSDFELTQLANGTEVLGFNPSSDQKKLPGRTQGAQVHGTQC